MNALEVQPDGRIFIIPNCPIRPSEKALLIHWEEYREALASADRIEISNQDVALDFLWRNDERINSPVPFLFWKENMLKPGIYPIPDLKWEKGIKKGCEIWCEMCKAFDWSTCKEKQVAVISLPESLPEKDKLQLFQSSIGKKFNVGELVCTVEYVDAKNKMIGTKYGEFTIDVCELLPESLPPDSVDENRVGRAATVVMFLGEYIHGVTYGKKDELNDIALRNAKDAWDRLMKINSTNNQNEKRIKV